MPPSKAQRTLLGTRESELEDPNLAMRDFQCQLAQSSRSLGVGGNLVQHFRVWNGGFCYETC